MALDLTKYLAFSDAIDADVIEAQKELDAASSAMLEAQVAFIAAGDRVKALQDVQRLMTGIKTDVATKTAPVTGIVNG